MSRGGPEAPARRLRFEVRVQPRASRTEVAGPHGAGVKIRLAAPPVDGAANAELVAFVAGELGVPRSAVRIVQGQRSRSKLIEVEGAARERLRAFLAG